MSRDIFARRFQGAQGGAKDLYDVRRHVRARRENARPGSVAWLMGILDQGPCASVGGYPIYFHTVDSRTLAWRTVRADVMSYVNEIVDVEPGRIMGIEVNWEDQNLHDDDTGERIESAYGESTSDGDTEPCDGGPEPCYPCQRGRCTRCEPR